MKNKWLVIISICSLLLGAGGTYASLLWILPPGTIDFSKEKVESEHEVAMEKESNPGLDKVADALELIRKSYVEDVSENRLIQGAIQGMVGTLQDPYSVYMDEEASERFNDSLDSSFDGIGAQIAIQEGKLIIISPIKNSPAEKAGLKARDRIISIDGESVEGLDVYEASKKIRGEKGTIVKLEIIRSGLSKPLVVDIKRDKVPVLTVFSDMKKSSEKNIGYIQITSFSQGTAKDFSTELRKLEEQNLSGLIIDVRGNPGGMLSSVEDILFQLVTDKKPYVQIEERSGKRIPYSTALKEKKPYPITVLIDEGSASASEILAAALNEIENYSLVGKKTFGKGTVQQAVPLDDHSNIKLTMFKWITPNGNWIHGKGIKPTIDVEQPAYFHVHSLQLEEALALDMNNENVTIAQEMLVALGYGPGRQDGYFDVQTERAVKAFQSINQIPVTGRIDEKTAMELQEKIISAIQNEKNDLQLQVALKTFR
ncbi:S41 family peptidase [Lederbergia wuyishanensis]|uniref:Carboxyl-terminal processing protease n=1 Tax=Lederbergia wuyishanensis TaxID=1347903 RepID=A0ABU0D8N9_9BACI|nr:S41 family peptidase [Lederbergia wuyishanensis]MCJ8007649.1 S41 family peptidase [Lederbergia wuyishanensis]MDQ0344766.1 carboxyl-terminal processing protease [Lederbergia wuyishanensis]